MVKTIRKLRQWPRLLKRSGFHYWGMKRARAPYWVSAGGGTCRIFADNDPGVREDYREIVIDDFYGIFGYSRREKPSLIVDIGANIGIFSRLCTLLFPDADICAYEPNPGAVYWLRKNAGDTHIRIFPYAVAKEGGDVTMFTRCDSLCGARIEPCGDLKVQSIAAREVAKGEDIDLLKMDCEGSEWSILEETNLLKRTKDFFLEYHLTGGHTIQELYGLVEGAGHRVTRHLPRREYHTNFGCLWSSRIKE
jgi:FkbM family methyltransferase